MIEPNVSPTRRGAASDRPALLCAVPEWGGARFTAPCRSGESRDAVLVAAVAFGRDQVAFEELYRSHIGAVTSAAMRICRDAGAAEEIAQRTFMTLWERAGRLAVKSVRLRPWLVTVARNAAIDHVRAGSACVPLDEAHARRAPAVCPQDQAVINAVMADLAPALAGLAPAQRAVIDMRYFEGRSFPDIAARLGEPLETVKSRARLAIAHLRRSLM